MLRSVGSAPATAKGRRTRDAMVGAAASLMYERGIDATAVEDVLAASDTGKSQMYHYFGGKRSLVVAVLEHQLDRVLAAQPSLTDADCADLARWRREVLAAQRESDCGNCPLGVFAGQVDNDPVVRDVLAELFGRWQRAIADLVRRAIDAGRVPAHTDADAVGGTLLAALQGGIVLSHLRRDPGPLVAALDSALASITDDRQGDRHGR